MRRQTVRGWAAVCGAVIALTVPASAQEIRVRVKVDPAVVDEVKAAIQDAINSDIGREIAEAIRDAARDTRRAMPALERMADAAAAGWQDRNYRVEQKDTETKTLQLGANGSLELKNVSGDITVTAGSGRDATVEIVRLSKRPHGRGREAGPGSRQSPGGRARRSRDGRRRTTRTRIARPTASASTTR